QVVIAEEMSRELHSVDSAVSMPLSHDPIPNFAAYCATCSSPSRMHTLHI
ncbi:hypothetical protein V3C99_010802, partial [Haemonchus contortus]